jgi:hypothetical protein
MSDGVTKFAEAGDLVEVCSTVHNGVDPPYTLLRSNGLYCGFDMEIQQYLIPVSDSYFTAALLRPARRGGIELQCMNKEALMFWGNEEEVINYCGVMLNCDIVDKKYKGFK